MRNPTATHQAPETPAPGTGSLKSEKSKRADHYLLDAQGAEVDEEEVATGIRYTLVANGQSFDYQYGANADADRMLALFGAKTLCTNESSAVRNSPKGEGSPDEQIDAVRERFALLTTGKWVDRTREGVGAKVDLDRLANAICNVQVAKGIYTAEQVQNEKLAAVRAKLDDDKAWARKARQQPEFAAEYVKLGGAASASIDDFTV